MNKIVNGVSNDYEFPNLYDPNISYSKAYTEQLLSEKDKIIERYKKRIEKYQDKIKDLELKNSILEYNNNKAIRILETLKGSARWERHLYEIDDLIVTLKGE